MISTLLLGVAPGARPEPAQRASATVDESLLARTIQAKDNSGWVGRVVWGGVGWGFNDDPSAGTMHRYTVQENELL